MRLGRTFTRSAAISLLTGLTVSAASAGSIVWTGGGGNNSWHTAANWNLNRVPQAGDDVVIPDTSPDVTVTFNSGATQISSLAAQEALALAGGTLTIDGPSTLSAAYTQSAGTLNGDGALALTGTFSWTGGTLGGAGDTLVSGALSIAGAATKTLTRNLDCDANATWTGSGQLWIGEARTLRVRAGRTFEIQNGATLSWTAARGTLRNEGTLRKAASSGVTSVQVTVESPGNIEILAGSTLDLSFASDIGGSVSGTGALQFGAGSHTVGPTGAVALATVVSGGTTTCNGAFTVPALTISAGALVLESATEAVAQDYTQSAGTLGGATDLVVNGAMIWTGGTITGAGGVRLNGPGSWSGGSTKTLTRSADVANEVIWSGTGQLWVGDAKALTILPGGRLEIQNDATMSWTGARGTLRNNGTLRKSVAAGSSTIQPVFENNALVEIASGRINAGFDGLHAGAVQGPGAFEFGGGNHVVTPAAAFSGAAVIISGGTIDFDGALNVGAMTVSGGSIDLGGGFSPTVGSYTHSAGTLTGSDDLTVTGPMLWTFGTIAGAGTLFADGGAALSGTSTKTLRRNLVHGGNGSWRDSGQLWIADLAVFTNQPGAVFEIQNDSAISWTGLRGSFTNLGTVRKTGGGGVTTAQVAFNNHNLVEIQSGTLALAFGGVHGGAFTGPGRLEFSGELHTVQPSGSIAARDVLFSGGTSDIHGAYDLVGSSTTVSGGVHTVHPAAAVGSIGDTLTITGGTIDFSSGDPVEVASFAQSGGTLTGADDVTVTNPLAWSGGTISGTGTLYANGGALLSGPQTKTLARDLQHAGSGSWTGAGQLWIGDAAVFTNLAGALFEIRTDAGVSWNVLPRGTISNLGTLRKSASSGTTTVHITLQNAGVVDVDSGTLELAFDFPNFAGTTLTGGAYRIAGTFRFPNANIVTNAATIVLDGPASAIQNTAQASGIASFAANTPAGVFRLLNGRGLAVPGPFSNAGELTVASGSAFSSGGSCVQTGGVTTLDAGTLSAVGVADIQGGVLCGNGVINASVVNAGEVIPGRSPGELVINGAYAQLAGGELRIEVEGLPPVTGFDRLSISGAASLAGTLHVSVADPAQPQVGELYEFLSAAARSGTFGTVNTPCLTGGNRVLVSYDADGAALQIVNPLPADLNCDCALDFFDIDPFLLALFNPAGYAATFPDCDMLLADTNNDDRVDFFDIDPFLALLFGVL